VRGSRRLSWTSSDSPLRLPLALAFAKRSGGRSALRSSRTVVILQPPQKGIGSDGVVAVTIESGLELPVALPQGPHSRVLRLPQSAALDGEERRRDLRVHRTSLFRRATSPRWSGCSRHGIGQWTSTSQLSNDIARNDEASSTRTSRRVRRLGSERSETGIALGAVPLRALAGTCSVIHIRPVWSGLLVNRRRQLATRDGV
jgi:hypothetical protein